MNMKRCVKYAVFAVVVFSVLATAQEKKRLSFEQIFKGAEPKLLAPLPNIVGWANDDHYLVMKKKEGDEQQKVYSVEAKNGKEKVYRDLSQYKDIVEKGVDAGSPAAWNEDYTRLIYVKDKDLYFLNTQKKDWKRLTQTEAEEKNPMISPDGKYVAFTRDNNLFAINLDSGEKIQYTSDGGEVVYNGWASWVYYEEILGRPSRYRAFWWSPDSRRILFYRFDDSKVPMFPLYSSEGQHGSIEKTRYPKVGDPNPEVRIGVVPVAGGPVTWGDFNEKQDQYFGMPFWTPDGKQAFVQWMNRQQDTMKIYAVNPETGAKAEIYTEYQKSWVEWFESLHFLKNNKGFILRSDKDGWSHLYLHAMDGRPIARLTEGKWAVSDIEAVDEDDNMVYFTAKKEASTRTDLYKVQLDGKNLVRLTFGPYTHNVNVSPKGKFFITRYSNVSTPTMMVLCNSHGNTTRELGTSKTKDFDNYLLAKTELFHIRTADGYELPATWTLPLDFDQNKKYPVIIGIYGGPSSPTVSDSWGGLRSQWLASEGAIQFSVDHRGSGHFGKEGAALMHRNLGKWEMNDYIEAVKWLRTKPFVDSTKVCITGGSYGGYVTCMALTYGADYFTHGIASSSPTSWELYDSHYTERYMDTKEENPEGYKFASVLTHADKYKGMLLIVHGTMDDNVHMQNSIQLIDKLEDLGKHFEMMVYPGGRHGWGGAKATHSRNESYRFYYRYLLGKPFPEELFGK
jgi:dipeptidyl-peptidase-4